MYYKTHDQSRSYYFNDCWALSCCKCYHITCTSWYHYVTNSSACIYLFKVNSRNTRKKCKFYSKLTIKTTERGHWCRCSVHIINFEHAVKPVGYLRSPAVPKKVSTITRCPLYRVLDFFGLKMSNAKWVNSINKIYFKISWNF